MRMIRTAKHLTWVRGLALYCAGTAVMVDPPAAQAQLAPVSGAHHAARSADTGFQGGVNPAVGAYNASVPLDLPAARDGLSLPLQVVYGGNSVGAAGLGWSIPISSISRSSTTSRRRPAPGASVAPKAAEQFFLELDGRRVRLVRNAANTAWVAQRGDAQIEVRSNGDGLMVMYDGSGRSYHFSSQGAQAGSRLRDGNLFLLRSIVSPGSNRVELGYSLGTPALPGGGSGLAINLTSLSYNVSPAQANCFKHKVLLSYDAAGANLLSMAMVDGAVMARTQKLTGISVRSKETCAFAEKALANYTFTYQADADTGRPRLRSVTMTGQQGTPEQNVALPIASYSYGSIVDSSNRITYQKVAGVALPNLPPANDFNVGYSVSQNTSQGGTALSQTATHQGLIDLNGDGRSDFYTQVHGETTSRVHVNASSAAGPTDLSFAYTATNPPTLSPTTRNFRAGHHRSDLYTDADANITNDTMTQFIDMNGDGRLDLVSAGVDQWTVRLNMADPSDPRKSQFVERIVNVSNLREVLAASGHLPGLFLGNEVPLARTTTLQLAPNAACWRHVVMYNNWLPAREEECSGIPTPDTRKKSIVEFELKDVNGDGYPDFIYNASHVATLSHLKANPPPTPVNPGATPPFVVTTQASDLAGSRDIKVFLNTAGVHLGNNEPVFASQPVMLEAGTVSGCGIARWEVDASDSSGGKQNQRCGLQDVNGDGLADRVLPGANGQAEVKLGTGDMAAPFTAGAALTLPGPLARNETPMTAEAGRPGMFQPSECAGGAAIYFSRLVATLRDVNADGIPDYLRTRDDGVTLEASLGTGTGFAPGVALSNGSDGQALTLSRERSFCAGRVFERAIAGTVAGLHELDGDGQPEFLRLNTATRQWEIYQLKAPLAQVDVGTGIAGVPAAGRLIRIDNGYGASTTIGYRSAKEEWNPGHAVPFPEIVVESVGTKDSSNGTLLSTQRYAYRGAEMAFNPAADAFLFPGYRRSVALTHANGKGTATVTDSHGLEPFVPGMTAAQRFARYLKPGLTREVTTVQLSGANHDNPWDVLNIDTARDTRRIAGASYSWEARQLVPGATPAGNERCIDMMYPYDLVASRSQALSPTDDLCTHHGFVFQGNAFTWRGVPGSGDALASQNTVQTNTAILAIDDRERITRVRYDNDLNRADDDLCVMTEYAEPTGTQARVLIAPFRQTASTCDTNILLSRKTYEYDTSAAGVRLPPGKVSQGRLTARTVARVDTATGAAVDPAHPQIRQFDAVYDAATGNRLHTTTAREDGATVTTTTAYDAFGLVPISTQIDATNADGSKPPLLTTTRSVDPLTLLLLSTTDTNGTGRSSTYDGFGRLVLSKVTPAGGSEGVMAKASYSGFGIGQNSGRSITRKEFTNPVPPATVATAPGRSGTVFLDNLGRVQRSEMALGADYSNQTLIIGQRSYDLYGRVDFEADPYPAGQSLPAPYGTTYHFHADGTPQCTYRAYGKQSFADTPRTTEADERLVACSSHSFSARQEVVSSFSADTNLAGSPQEHMPREQTYSAIGRLLQDRTVDRASDTPFAESMSFGYDPLGHMIRMSRVLAEDDSELLTTWRYDSLGQMIRSEETGSDPQYRRHDHWGALVATEWCDTTAGSCANGSFNRGSYSQYDALGRLRHSEDRRNNVAVPETLRDFVYDQGVNSTTPPVTATHVLGRLAKAMAPTSSVSFSYDGFGRAQAEVHVDRSVTPDQTSPDEVFVQKNDYHGDGALKGVHLLLPDAAFRDEKADYSYDSAGRLRSVRYSDGVLDKDLFTSAGSSAIDVFGRIREAKFGANSYSASYADVGRRLLNSVKVASPGPMTTSREFVFGGTNGSLPAFDPVGRERSRKEISNGATDTPTLTSTYDALGRLQRSSRVSSGLPERIDYAYDSLGNILSHTNTSVAGQPVALTTLSYQSVDNDRVCSIGFNGAAPSPACNVRYDGLGNIVEMPTRASGLRTLSYFPAGQTREIVQGGTRATYDYDAFGAVQRLSLTSSSSTDTRKDKHFGRLIYQREEVVNNVRTPVNTRSFPGPVGLLATRHGGGAASPWTFAFGEQRGNRFFTDHTGAFVQDLDYQPYGEARTPGTLLPGSLPGSPLYTNAQWNGGDALAALGVSQLGARIYDPVIGRFLSRDPLIVPRTAGTTNPYAFALNDPVNLADPSGLDIGLVGELKHCYSCRNESAGTFRGDFLDRAIRGVAAAAAAIGRALAAIDWGGGPMVSRGNAPVLSFQSTFNGTRGASPTSANAGGAGGGRAQSVPGNHIADDGSVGPAVAGPPNQVVDICSMASCEGSPSAADGAPVAPRPRREWTAQEKFEYDKLKHELDWRAGTEFMSDASEKSGDGMDILGYIVRSPLADLTGNLLDTVGYVASVVEVINDPSWRTVGKAAWGVVGNLLMTLGPPGATAKYGAETIAPMAVQAHEMAVELDQRLQNPHEVRYFWSQIVNGPDVDGLRLGTEAEK